MTKQATDSDAHADNAVFLRGRLADLPELRELPSGDVLAAFRVTVARPAGGRARVDSIECASTRARVHRTLRRVEPGGHVEIVGSLHRRFWRSPTGPASRYAVDVASMRVIRPGRPTGASPARTRASA